MGLETSPLRISREVMSAPTKRKTQPENALISWPRLLSLTIPTKSTLDTPQSWIATPPTLPVNSTPSPLRSTEELVRFLKRTHNSSSPVMPPLSNWSHPSQCALRPSRTTHLLVDSPSEI